MFNQGGFNGIAFNVKDSNYTIKSQDTIQIVDTEETTSQNSIDSADNITIDIVEEIYIVFQEPIILMQVNLSEDIDIFRETSGLDPPQINLEEDASIDRYISTTDNLELSFSIFAKGKFNQQGFNQGESIVKSLETSETVIKVQDNLTVAVDEEDYTLNAISSLNDGLLTIVDEDIEINSSLYMEDSWGLYFEEITELDNSIVANDSADLTIEDDYSLITAISLNDGLLTIVNEDISISRETSSLDATQITLGENANVDKDILVADNLEFSFSVLAEGGFNQQGFNQGGFIRKSLETSEIAIKVQDNLTVAVDEGDYNLNVISSLNDSLVTIVEDNAEINSLLYGEEVLEPYFEESRKLDKPIPLRDNIDLTVGNEVSLGASINVQDEMNSTLETSAWATSPLMLVKDGTFVKIVKGYVLVEGEWKTIIKHSGVVNGEWKKLISE